MARLVDLLLIQVVRWWIATGDDGRASWLRALRDPTLAAVLAAVHERPGRAVDGGGSAATAHVSRATLARRFAEEVGEPPLAYLTRWRMELAARRLRDGDEPVETIARAVGYTSEYAFNRAFARHRGDPPGRFRRGGVSRPSARRARRAGRRRGSGRPASGRACRRSGCGTR